MFRRLFIAMPLVLVACATSTFGDPAPDGGSDEESNSPADCISPPCSSNDDGCVDGDGDTFGVGCAAGSDCDDTSANRAPNLIEFCDGMDNDCNGMIDDGLSCGGPNPTPPSCMDADQDSYGEGCPAGPDCDDGDPSTFMGATELCDGKDNDCDTQVDEDFPLGGECSEGMGPCMAAGTMVCTPDGAMAQCNAAPGQPQTEVCDRIDNDCDGTPDDGLNCPACIEDGNEPDDSSLTGTTLASGSVTGQLCPGNVDWFRLGDFTVGQTVSVTLDFPQASGDIDMEMYVGATYETGSYSATDGESITRTLSKSGAVTIRLYFDGAPPASGNSYTIRRP